MKVCIIGDGLVSLTLANVLIQKDLFVDVLRTSKKKQYLLIEKINQKYNYLGILKYFGFQYFLEI